MFRVYSYTPSEGPAGSSIIVNVHFNLPSADTTFLRIVVGHRALSTTVRQAQDRRFGEWELEAMIPELETASLGPSSPSTVVPLTVQALNGTNETLDSVTFGKFTYSHHRVAASPSMLCKEEIVDTYNFASASPSPSPLNARPVGPAAPVATRKSSRPTPGSGTARARALNATMASKDAQSARGQLKKQSLIRARRSGSDDDDADSAFRAVLRLETPLDTVADPHDWDPEERRIGRRLVRFSRVQEGCVLRVTCEAILPSEYADGDTVVSCIYRPADATGAGDPPVSKCCITSVDIIFLLECLVGDIFNIEEKNRIRRNLEGFRPKTVSKNKVGTEEFFQKIMDFPAPKPRNIEKDVKVFDWAVLPQALDKIISKYTLYPAAKKQDADGSSSEASTTPMTMSPDMSQSSLATPYSQSSSPQPGHPSPPPTDQSYFSFHPPNYPRTQYISGSLDALDSSYVTATSLSSAGAYDVLLPSHTTTPTPSPLISTPHDSPHLSGGSSMSLQYPSTAEQYIEPSHSLYQSSLMDHEAYGGNVYAMGPGAYDVDYHTHGLKISPGPDLHDAHAYL
ncbi:uncharacterized protein TRAVEDRAFT_17589 [Trametes versicolor FP-101664 SS1]|uniref:uncharacterized protein n=1 Tax=Trametes versicolor (strain FP-101664) TaxID=717944 RepID=UPI00046247C4|nr:uncharacterized protein TRAVEDRAFT_17589 [Trametes versicolor FP-101664 SS1]EIW63134.1 hypothetical protein TRAVEDRAFT_17589 [Trametes versicolor FP-101664 SS1]